MTLYPRLVTVGKINSGATPIQADVSFIDANVAPVKVTLATDYEMIDPVEGGYPARPFTVGRDAANLQFPRTIPAGTTIALLKNEADALVDARALVENQAEAIPSAAPYTVTVADSDVFIGDQGVVYANNLARLTAVASNPASGQYSVAAGIYTFNAADAAKGVLISYTIAAATYT